MEDIEDGECSSDGDSIAGYTPIERPTDAKPSFKPAGKKHETCIKPSYKPLYKLLHKPKINLLSTSQ